jgi:hypothetical protein
MRIHSSIIRLTVLVLLLTAGCRLFVRAQDGKEEKAAALEAQLKMLVDSQHYDFVAQMAIPMNGSSRQLNSYYDLKISPDELVCFLPYIGQAYTPTMNTDQNGLDFTSKKYTYKVTPRKKGGWNVQIKPKDYSDVQAISMIISENGYTTVQVTSLTRQMITFNGYITTPQPKKT